MIIRNTLLLYFFLLIFTSQLFGQQSNEVQGISKFSSLNAQNNTLEDEYRNYHGLCWGKQNTLEDACRYSHAMNYNYVMVHPVALDSGAYTNNLRFIAVNPHKTVLPEVENLTLTEEKLEDLRSRWSIFYDYPNVRQYINYDHYDELKAYDLEVWTAYKNICEKFFIWNDTTQTFPHNLALIGKDWGGYPILDIQQQAVIDWFVPYFINHVKTRMEKPSENFLFYGVASDQPGHWRLQTRVVEGAWVSGVSESAPLHDSITHEYPDIEIGTYEFWRSLASMERLVHGSIGLKEPVRVSGLPRIQSVRLQKA